jgi:twinkle protein
MMDDSNFDWVDIPGLHRHDQPGYFSLRNLKQRPSVESICVSTGWHELDAFWKLYPGQFTVVTGLAGHGKSTFLLNVICNMAIKSGVRSFLYMPENEAHLLNKMRKLWGDRDGFDYFCEEQCFVQTAAPTYLDRPVQDLRWVLNRAEVALKKDDVGVLLIDPWNELEFSKPKTQTMTDYIRDCLMLLKQFCRMNNVAVILVAHPTKAVTENGGRTPTLADIENSMSWYNKCDNGLVVVRNMETMTCKVISAKVREEGSGKIGACMFYVDQITGRFTPQYAGEVSGR